MITCLSVTTWRFPQCSTSSLVPVSTFHLPVGDHLALPPSVQHSFFWTATNLLSRHVSPRALSSPSMTALTSRSRMSRRVISSSALTAVHASPTTLSVGKSASTESRSPTKRISLSPRTTSWLSTRTAMQAQIIKDRQTTANAALWKTDLVCYQTLTLNQVTLTDPDLRLPTHLIS